MESLVVVVSLGFGLLHALMTVLDLYGPIRVVHFLAAY